MKFYCKKVGGVSGEIGTTPSTLIWPDERTSGKIVLEHLERTEPQPFGHPSRLLSQEMIWN
ncbi:hypothetical protein T06_14662 [Trichinella sp. T6]|nr:hypothetical protein T06_14662 [Trichinella sp. T6]